MTSPSDPLTGSRTGALIDVASLVTGFEVQQQGLWNVRITIVGAGAMGSLIAARLTQASSTAVPRTGTTPASGNERERDHEGIERVLLFGRPSAHLDAIHAHGLHMTELDGSTHTVPIGTSSEPADVKGSDVVIVLVKSWASAEAVAPLRTYLTRETVVLTLQNGLGNASMLRNALLEKGVRPHVWLGVTTQAAIRTSPGALLHTGDGITAIGRRHAAVNTSIQHLATTLSVDSWKTVAVDDIHRWVWRKLAVNCVINPLTALAGVPNAAISNDAELATVATQVAAEVVAVAHAQKVNIEMAEVTAAIEEVARSTGTNRSSMLVDLENDQRTEIDAINGAIVAEGKRFNIQTPVNELLVTLIRARERQVELDLAASSLTTATP